LTAIAAASHYRRQTSKDGVDQKIIPRVDKKQSGRLEKIEKFSDYVGMFYLFVNSLANTVVSCYAKMLGILCFTKMIVSQNPSRVEKFNDLLVQKVDIKPLLILSCLVLVCKTF